jgi:toxin ParE1/3/4
VIPVELSSDADADLSSIFEYGIDTFGESVAEAYLFALKSALERLSEYPELGVLRADLNQKPRCLPCREHHIFYRFDGERILVGRILHKAMDLSRWLM